MATNLELVTYALWKIGVVDETQQPSAVQGNTALVVANDFFLNQAADGMRVGWYTQTDLQATAPLRSQDIGPAKSLLAGALAAHYGIKLDPMKDAVLLKEIADAMTALTKRSILYLESDLGELSRPQAGPWGGPGWF